MAHVLPPLTYPNAALEPHIDARTMEIHHDKHHQTYITNLNTAIAGTDLEGMTAEELITSLDRVPEEKRAAVRNNGGGHVNHSMFWQIMGPGGGGAPTGPLAEAIERDLGGLEAMKEAVNKAGATRFGSGWAWVVVKGGTLSAMSTPNQDNPTMDGSGTPILGVDVWEHAYYLNYQNRRPDYLTAWWNTVNWAKVAELYAAASA